MREIKFRALNSEGDIIHNIGSIEFFEDGTIIVNNEVPVKELMQYTGLKDKNGVEIYEGDILRSHTPDKTPIDVIWDDKNACFCCHGEHFGIPSYKFFEREVIGNIYENPELLET